MLLEQQENLYGSASFAMITCVGSLITHSCGSRDTMSCLVVSCMCRGVKYQKMLQHTCRPGHSLAQCQTVRCWDFMAFISHSKHASTAIQVIIIL
jgi:hypothetical protein